MNVGKACLKLLVFYFLCAAAVGVAVFHRFPVGPAAFWSGVIAGFFLWLTLAYLWAIPYNFLEFLRMRPGVPLRDGKKAAVFGQIRAAGHSIHAPFSKTACLAYEYKIRSAQGEHESTDFEGFALVPSYVASEDGLGQVKILAYPELDVTWEHPYDATAKENAKAWIAATKFVNTREGGLKGMLAEVKKLQSDDDGAIRYDYRIEPVADDLDHSLLQERVLRAGETVCATGLYSEAKRALVPDPSASLHAITIRRGEVAALRRAPLKKAWGSAIGVVILSVLLAAAAGLFLVNVPMDSAEQMKPERRFFWEEVKLERWLDREVKTPLQKSGTLSTQGMFFLELCEGCATGRLEANGRVVELRHGSGWQSEETRVMHLAAGKGERDGVTISEDRKARTVEVAIVMNGVSFQVPGEWLQERDFQTAFDDAETLDGRITVMAPNDAVRARASFRIRLTPAAG